MKYARFILLLIIFASSQALAGDDQVEDAFSPKEGATELIISTIAKAHKIIRVAAYTFTSQAIADALIDAAHNGVDVKVVIDMRQSNGRASLAKYLVDNGIPTRKNGDYAIMHNKFMVIDDNILELGSFNYTKAAEEKNAENVLVLHPTQKIIDDYSSHWNTLWSEATE